MAETWRDANYNYRKEITVQDANIDGDLSAFPVLVALDSDSDLNTTASKVQADLDDIRFYDGSGNLLKFEVESYTIDGTDCTARIWVNKPSLKASPAGTENQVWMYYGYGSASSGEDAANVWDANFGFVAHMNDDAASTAVASSKGGVDGTANRNTEDFNTASGKVGGALDFNGSSDDVTTDANIIDPNAGAFTMEAWVNGDTFANLSTGENQTIIHQNNGTGTGRGALYVKNNSGTLKLGSIIGGSELLGGEISAGTWYFVAVTLSGGGAGATRILYTNATSVNDTTNPEACNGTHLIATHKTPSSTGEEWDGKIDEMRMSDVARSADWLKFGYHNIAEADNELTWGAEETQAASPVSTTRKVPWHLLHSGAA